jgi:glycosyltransferase involved in cell wall biosynthesis
LNRTPVRILRVIASVNPTQGGPVAGIRAVTPVLATMGVETEIACVDSPAAGWLGSVPQAKVHALGPAQRPWARSPQLVPWLRANGSRFDAVIMHGLWLHPSYAVWQAFRPPSTTPYFVYPHGMLDPWFQNARPIKALRNTIYWKLIEHRVVRDATGVLFTCDEERRLAREPFRPYASREVVVNYGSATPPLDRDRCKGVFLQKHSELIDKNFLLFLSRIHRKKGVDLLLKAWSGQLKTGKTPPHLAIAGPCADTAYLDGLKRLASELDLTPHITWLPMLEGDAKWGALNACEAFILPSHQENFGIAVVESLACGRPVLISDKVNIWREIQSDGSGLVAPDTTQGVSQLVEAWQALDARAREKMNLLALESFEQRFTIAKAAESIVNVIRGATAPAV